MGDSRANRRRFAARSLTNSFRCAGLGVRICWLTQRNFRIHVVCAWVALGLALLLRISLVQALIILMVAASVLLTELFNTVVEWLLDCLVPGYSPLVGHIKNVAAGAVLIAALAALMVGFFILGPALVQLPYLWEQAWQEQPAVLVIYALITLGGTVASLRIPLERLG